MQWLAHRNDLDDSVENHASPTSTDTRDYDRRAGILASGGGFTTAFADGYRMPGYPVFSAAFQRVFESPRQAARIAQVLASSLLPLFAFLTLLNLLGNLEIGKRNSDGWNSLAGAALVTAWPPLTYFSPILIAEACSLFVLSILLWVLSRPPDRRFASGVWRWTVPAVLLSLLVYLKPNHFILVLPVAILLWCRGDLGTKTGTRSALAFTALSLALLAPWSIFVSRHSEKPVFLTTASDVNLYLGTGVAPDSKETRTLPYRFSQRWIPAEMPFASGAFPDGKQIWKAHPLRTSLYGITKILHGFGFSFRDARDAILACLTVLSFWASVRLWRRRFANPGSALRAKWAVWFWGMAAVTAFQLFLYLPNQRLKTVLFDLPALLILVLGCYSFRPDGGGSAAKDEL